jgi:hypothetical protein
MRVDQQNSLALLSGVFNLARGTSMFTCPKLHSGDRDRWQSVTTNSADWPLQPPPDSFARDLDGTI